MKWLAVHKTGLNWPKEAKNHPKNITFRSGTGPDRCYICNQPLYFHQMVQFKVIRAQEGIPMSQNGSRPQKWPKLAKNVQNHPQKITFRTGREPDRCWFPWQSRTWYFGDNLDVFWPIQAAFMVGEPLCDVGTPSWALIPLLRVIYWK